MSLYAKNHLIKLLDTYGLAANPMLIKIMTLVANGHDTVFDGNLNTFEPKELETLESFLRWLEAAHATTTVRERCLICEHRKVKECVTCSDGNLIDRLALVQRRREVVIAKSYISIVAYDANYIRRSIRFVIPLCLSDE